MSLDRVINRYDVLMSKGEYEEAENLLVYWKNELQTMNDHKNLYVVLNELVGYYRKIANKEKGNEVIDELLAYISEHNIENEFSAATSYINIATAFSSFNKIDESYEYFEKALSIYENQYDINKLVEENENHINDGLIKKYASLYNNMAITFFGLEEYDAAIDYSKKAIELNENLVNGELDSAITYLNLANVIEKQIGLEDGDEEINKYMGNAKALLELHKNDTDSYYVYVMKRCVSAFDYYGYFAYANELKNRIDNASKQMIHF